MTPDFAAVAEPPGRSLARHSTRATAPAAGVLYGGNRGPTFGRTPARCGVAGQHHESPDPSKQQAGLFTDAGDNSVQNPDCLIVTP